MNRFKVVGLAVALAVSMSFAQGSLWTPTSEFGIVFFDWIDECMYGEGTEFDKTDSEDYCYKKLGGWWFGYVAGPSSGDLTGCGPSSTKSSAKNYLRAVIDGSPVSFVGPDNYNEGDNAEEVCVGPAITNLEDGTSLLDGALDLEFGIGDGKVSDYDPDISALAVNLSWANSIEGKSPETPRDFSDKGGFCLTYESDHKMFAKEDEGLALELGWLEDGADSKTNNVPYDVWFSNLPEGDGPQVVNLSWGNGTNSNSGDFIQMGWSSAPWSLEKAIKEMRSVKIRLKGYETTVVKFKLYQFGWIGECTMPGDTKPSRVVGTNVANALNFNMIGKTVHMTVSKPAMVQVVNLNGKVVHTQTVTAANKTMNLSNLPTGVYMLRVPSLGYTNKIVLK